MTGSDSNAYYVWEPIHYPAHKPFIYLRENALRAVPTQR
jgi:hypothetical protein